LISSFFNSFLNKISNNWPRERYEKTHSNQLIVHFLVFCISAFYQIWLKPEGKRLCTAFNKLRKLSLHGIFFLILTYCGWQFSLKLHHPLRYLILRYFICLLSFYWRRFILSFMHPINVSLLKELSISTIIISLIKIMILVMPFILDRKLPHPTLLGFASGPCTFSRYLHEQCCIDKWSKH
jgi:hypothetical protein